MKTAAFTNMLIGALLIAAVAASAAFAEIGRLPGRGTVISNNMGAANLVSVHTALSESTVLKNKLPLTLRGFAVPAGSFELSFNKVSVSDWKSYRYNDQTLQESGRPAYVLFTGQAKSRAVGTGRKARSTRSPASALLRHFNGRAELLVSFSTRGISGRRFHQAVFSQLEQGGVFKFHSTPATALSGKFCGTAGGDLAAWADQALSGAENQAAGEAAPVNLNREIELVTDCDYQCLLKNGGDVELANAKVAQMVNAANAVYGRQLGIFFNITAQLVRMSDSSYPSAITDSGALLDEFHLKAAQLPNADIKHLVTGRDLDGHVIGLGYSGCGGLLAGVTCLCPDFSQSLSTYINDSLSAVIMAHELGHNLGASHDPSSAGIMSAVLDTPSGSGFSAFSQTEIAKYVGDFGFLCMAQPTPILPDGIIVEGQQVSSRLSVSFKNRKFKALISVSGPSDLDCIADLRFAYSKAGLSSGKTAYYGEVSNNQISFSAARLPYISRRSKGAATPIWFSANLICDGVTMETNRTSVRAIAPKGWRGTMVNSRASWSRALRNTLR